MRTLSLDVTVRAVDGKDVSLTTESGHPFALPAEHVPFPCEPGGRFPLDLGALASAPLAEPGRAALAKAMLNEILTAS